ncbi:MAG TPA: glycosyltransferase family 2 protein [Xanthobacteraceae bacterium]|nr:glycosyltransferase family 2 protein [Xanthobacteraceae bacterium]
MPSDTAVVMAAHNAERTIRQAVVSVLDGTQPCDIFIVDDASRIPVTVALSSLAHRVTVIRLDENVGPGGARNAALKRILAADYKYVAIMDADDISHSTRLAVQRGFLESHPKVGVVGTWVRLFDERTGETVYSLHRATDSDTIRKLMYLNIGLSHATAMLRADALREVGIYDAGFAAAEDYELMRRIGTRYDFANIPECLLSYRISPNGQSRGRRLRQLYDRLRTQLRYFDPLAWRAWTGVIKTALVMLIPSGLAEPLKLRSKGLGTPGAAFPVNKA